MNTTSVRGYILDNLFYGTLAFVIYQKTLLKCLHGQSYDQSRIVLLSLIVVLTTVGVLINIRNRNGLSLFANVAFPFGVYTAIAYISLNRPIIIIALATSGIISGVFTAITMCRRIRGNKVWFVVLNRVKQVVAQAQFFFAIGLACAMVVLGGGVVFGASLLRPTVAATAYNETEEPTIQNNMETILMLQENVWKDLNATERLSVLQTVANIERRYLGIPHELNVGVANMGEHTLGSYDNRTYQIIVSLDSIMKNPVEEVVDTVCHEGFHSYQQSIVSAAENTSEEFKQLLLFREARNYAEEFCDCKSGGQEYYYQQCEVDARAYAAAAVSDYYQRIEEYLSES